MRAKIYHHNTKYPNKIRIKLNKAEQNTTNWVYAANCQLSLSLHPYNLLGLFHSLIGFTVNLEFSFASLGFSHPTGCRIKLTKAALRWCKDNAAKARSHPSFSFSHLGFYCLGFSVSELATKNHTVDSGGNVTPLSARCFDFPAKSLDFWCKCFGFTPLLEGRSLAPTPATLTVCRWVSAEDVGNDWHVELMSQQLDVSLGVWHRPADTNPPEDTMPNTRQTGKPGSLSVQHSKFTASSRTFRQIPGNFQRTLIHHWTVTAYSRSLKFVVST